MDEEWCRHQLEQLKITEDRLNTLDEIRNKLNESNALESAVTNSFLSSSEFFDCIDETTESAQNDMALDILSICMSHLSVTQTDLSQALEKSLNHKNPKIRSIALTAVLNGTHHNFPQPYSSFSEDLLIKIIECLQDPDTSVGVPAVGILSKVLVYKLNTATIKALTNQLSFDDTVKCRVYEVAVNLAKHSSETQNKVETILDHALSQLDNDDVLLQVNILEILVALAEQNHGLIFLEQRNVFDTISKRVVNLEQNPLDHLLIPGIMKFFGKIGSVQPQKIITGYPNMVLCLFDCFHSGDTSVLPTAFDTLANLAHTQQGKLLLDANYSEGLKKVFPDYVTYLKNYPTSLRNRAFNSLEIIFSSEDCISPEVSQVLEKWYLQLAGSPSMQFLMDFCKNPFPDLKVACLSFVKSVCRYQWGAMALKNTAGFLELLLDRRTEFDKDAKLAKYELIQTIADSPVFDLQTQLQFRTYVNQGPYYIQRVVEVAVEGC